LISTAATGVMTKVLSSNRVKRQSKFFIRLLCQKIVCTEDSSLSF
jgi:hypothetical protein